MWLADGQPALQHLCQSLCTAARKAFVFVVSQSGRSKLWLQQQGEEGMQALDSATPALQPLYLQIAAHEQGSASRNKSSPASTHHVGGIATAAQVSSHADGVQQSDAASSGDGSNGSGGVQGQLAWTATTASLRAVLQVLQQRQVLGTAVSPHQALAAFQDACYPGSQALQQG